MNMNWASRTWIFSAYFFFGACFYEFEESLDEKDLLQVDTMNNIPKMETRFPQSIMMNSDDTGIPKNMNG